MKTGMSSDEFDYPSKMMEYHYYTVEGDRITNPFTCAMLDVMRKLQYKVEKLDLTPDSRVSIEFKIHNKGLAYTEKPDNVYKVTGLLTVDTDGE